MNKLISKLKSAGKIIDLENQKTLFLRFFESRYLVLAIVFLITCWQSYYYLNRQNISDDYIRKYTTGFDYKNAHHFVYFYYYLNLFPVMTTAEMNYSEEGARQIIEDEGKTLMMEYRHWTRLGESARIWAFLPDAWARSSPEDPSITLFNALFFLAGLIMVFIGFLRVKLPLVGILIVIFLGSAPFFLYETYGRQNIFALPASVAMILLGLYLPLIFNRTSRHDWLLVVFSGFLIGFVCNIRAENLPIIVSCLIMVVFHGKFNRNKKIILSLLLIGSYYVTDKSIKAFFDHKFEEAYAVVESAGGHPYNGARIESHRFWHSVFCGLGDFDRKYGYEWNDSIAYQYAVPLLNERYGMDLKYSGDKYHLDQYYDADSLYYVKFDEIDEYEEMVKEKVLSDIKNDPLWYLEILIKRIERIFNYTSPVGTGFGYLKLKGIGWLLVPLLLVMLYFRRWSYIKILLFTTPLLVPCFIIYSRGNATYGSPYHLVMLALLLAWLIEYFLILRKKKNTFAEKKG